MTAVATKKNYKATFILDTRGREESVEQLIEDLKKEMAAQEVETHKAEHLGRRDFARKPDVNVPAGNYVQFELSGPIGAATRLQEHFRLNPVVYRILIEVV